MVRFEFRADASAYGDGIREILNRTEDRFHPPLSTREGTTQTAGLDERRNDALDEYLAQCLNQSFILTIDDDRVVGFLSFRQSYETDELAGYTPSSYVSTIAVRPAERRQGYARGMYHELLTGVPPGVRDPYVTTRTWSTNDRHFQLLDELGFETVTTIRDDRGEGINTVYYALPVAEYEP